MRPSRHGPRVPYLSGRMLSPVVVTESTGPVTVSSVYTSDFLAPDELDPYIQLVSAGDGAYCAEITTRYDLACVSDMERSDD